MSSKDDPIEAEAGGDESEGKIA